MANFDTKANVEPLTRVVLSGSCVATQILTSFFVEIQSERMNPDHRIAELILSQNGLTLGLETRNPPCEYRGAQRRDFVNLATAFDVRDLAEESGAWTLYGRNHFTGFDALSLDATLTAIDVCADMLAVSTVEERTTLAFLRRIGIEVVTAKQFFRQMERDQPLLYRRIRDNNIRNADVSREMWNAWFEPLPE